MAKIELDDVVNLVNQATAKSTINLNNTAIEAAIEKTLSRDGTAPNQMEADFDMNSKRILNLPAAVSGAEPVRKAEFDDTLAALGDTASAIASIATSVAAASASASSAASSAASAANAEASIANSVDSISDIVDGTWPGNTHITTIGTISTGTVPLAHVSGAGTIASQDYSAVSITGGTITGLSDPTIASAAATKNYVDSIGSGLHPLSSSAKYATTSALPTTPVYANGTLGVGATLTAGSNAAISIDSASPSVNDRILVKDEATQSHNGMYVVSVVGDGSTKWVLTRATDNDTTAEMPNGTYVFVSSGTVNANTSWLLVQSSTITIGTTALPFTQFSATANSWSTSGSDITNANAGTVKVGSLTTTGLTGVLYGNGASPVTAVTTTGIGNVMRATAPSMTGNLKLNGNWLSGDGGNEGVYVDGSGNVGVGTSSPATQLHTTGSVRFAGLPGRGELRASTTGVLSVASDCVYVRDFGAVGDGSTDDSTAINNAITYMRSLSVNVNPTLSFAGDPTKNSYVVTSTLNFTGLRGFLFTLDLANSTIIGRTTGKPIIDAMDSQFFHIKNGTIYGDPSFPPTYGIQMGRGIIGNDAANCSHANIFMSGSYSLATFLNSGCEVFLSTKCMYWNGHINGHCVYQDGRNAANVASDFFTVTALADTPISFNDNRFVNCTFEQINTNPAKTGSAIVIAGTTNSHHFDTCYGQCEYGYGVVLSYNHVSLHLDIHFEAANLLMNVALRTGVANMELHDFRLSEYYAFGSVCVIGSENTGAAILSASEISVNDSYHSIPLFGSGGNITLYGIVKLGIGTSIHNLSNLYAFNGDIYTRRAHTNLSFPGALYRHARVMAVEEGGQTYYGTQTYIP